jgi:hypothetical protein
MSVLLLLLLLLHPTLLLLLLLLLHPTLLLLLLLHPTLLLLLLLLLHPTLLLLLLLHPTLLLLLLLLLLLPLRFVQGSISSRLEVTATITPGCASFDRSRNNSNSMLEAKPNSKMLALRRSIMCMRSGLSAREPGAEGPVRALLVRDDRAWAAGGRGEPWLALFDAVAGVLRDMVSFGVKGKGLGLGFMGWGLGVGSMHLRPSPEEDDRAEAALPS